MRSEQFTISSNYNPSAVAVPESISIDFDKFEAIETKKRFYSKLTWVVGVLLIFAAVGLIIGLISPIFSLRNTTTTMKMNTNLTAFVSTAVTSVNTVGTSRSGISSTTLSGISTGVGTTQAATTTVCPFGYSRAPSGLCVDLLIDFNNCGSFGYVCSSNYTSCSNGICSGVPGVTLVGGIPVTNWGGSNSADDFYTTLNLPLSLTLYNYSTSNVSISTNGVVCLGICSIAYSNGNLPTSSFGGPTAFGYWDDLMIYAGTSQNIYYNVIGTAPNRTTTFEFYESHYAQSTEYYRFQIQFYENLPGIVKFIYLQATDGGVSATIGVQYSSTGPAITYSVNQANSVTTNMVLTFNINTGTYVG